MMILGTFSTPTRPFINPNGIYYLSIELTCNVTYFLHLFIYFLLKLFTLY